MDLTKEMKVSPSVKEVDGKNKSSLFVNQDGKALKHAFTRDNPNGMPDMEQVLVNGQNVWDDTKRLAFLQNMVDTTIMPKLVGVVTPVAPDGMGALQAIPVEGGEAGMALEDIPVPSATPPVVAQTPPVTPEGQKDF